MMRSDNGRSDMRDFPADVRPVNHAAEGSALESEATL
jgi:hypothetical protein